LGRVRTIRDAGQRSQRAGALLVAAVSIVGCSDDATRTAIRSTTSATAAAGPSGGTGPSGGAGTTGGVGGTGAPTPTAAPDSAPVAPDGRSIIAAGTVPLGCVLRDAVSFDAAANELIVLNPDRTDDASGRVHTVVSVDAKIALASGSGANVPATRERLAALLREKPTTLVLCGTDDGWSWIEPAPQGDPVRSGQEIDADGVGSIEVGKRYQDVEIATGRPVAINDALFPNGECAFVSFGVDGLGGLGGDGTLRRVEVLGGSWQTDAGIAIGSTEAQVRAAYPSAVHQTDPLRRTSSFLVAGPRGDAAHVLVFEIVDGKVAGIRAGERSWALIAGGCL
jgi:hypothetical protein